jgi:hypothetical protein
MGPEEFFHRNRVISTKEMFEMRVKSLDWMLDCYNRGTIRRKTIVNLIPLQDLYTILDHLEEIERYEDCMIIKEVIDTIYLKLDTNIENMSKKKRLEVIKNLENTLFKESLKVGGGNKELMIKLQAKLDKAKSNGK